MKLGSIYVCTFLIINLVGYTKAACSDGLVSLNHAVLQRARQTAARRLLGSVSEADITQYDALVKVNITTGQELVAALANPDVGVITLIVPSVTVTPDDWKSSSMGLPIELRRNVTLEGSGEWPQLKLKYVHGVVRMGDTVRMTFTYMHVHMEGLLGKPSRLAGTDIFAPTDQNGPPTEVWFVSVSLYTPYCFVGYLRRLDITLTVRPPQYPGNQTDFVDINQTGCVNTTTAPPLQRCWAGKYYVQDYAFEGIDIDPVTSAVLRSNLLFRFLNNTFVCQFQVDPACTAIKDPMICYGETVSKYNDLSSDGSSNGSYTRSPTVLPQPPSNSSSSTGSSRNDGGLQLSGSSGSNNIGVDNDAPGAVLPVQASANGHNSRAALIIGASIGTSILAIIAAVAVGLVWRRCHQLRQDEPRSPTAADCQPDLPIDAPAVTISTAAAAATVAGIAACEVPKATVVEIASGVAPPVTHKTPPAPNIPLNVTLVQLRPQQPVMATTDGGCDSSSVSMVPPAAPPGGSLTEPAAREGHQVILRVGGAKATAEACLQIIDEHAPLQGPSDGDGENVTAAEAASGGSSCGERSDIQQAATDGAGGCSVSRHQNSPFLPRVNIALADAVMLPEGCTSSNYGVLTEGSESGSSGEGDGMVGLLPGVLGKGSFGRVVEGMYKGRRVAVKLMASEEPWAEVSANSFARMLVQEVEVLSRCAHPNVVRLLAARVTPPHLCLVMELMDTSLERLIHHNTDESEMPLPKVLHIGICIANALAYMHPTIVHRDLKPANVLISYPKSDKPIVKLTDFGLSRLRITVGYTEHPDAGTPAYMAPECFDVSNQRITHHADIYSLGVLLWEMLAMTRPWIGMGPVAVGFMVTYKGVRPPLDCLSGSRCPHKLARLLVACWDGDPARRPAAAEVAKELTLVLLNVERQGEANRGQQLVVQEEGKQLDERERAQETQQEGKEQEEEVQEGRQFEGC